eukprot:3127611-Pleurochrysis_carterae.AAC.1
MAHNFHSQENRIIELSSGKQPMSERDGGCNGEGTGDVGDHAPHRPPTRSSSTHMSGRSYPKMLLDCKP